MAKSFWIKSKKISEKLEITPIALYASAALVAFGFSIYFVYHVSKRSADTDIEAPRREVVDEPELNRLRGLMRATTSATDTSGTDGAETDRTPKKIISIEEEQKEKSVVDESELTRLRSLMKSKQQ